MSVANNGVSRFQDSVIYSTPTFAAGLDCSEISNATEIIINSPAVRIEDGGSLTFVQSGQYIDMNVDDTVDYDVRLQYTRPAGPAVQGLGTFTVAGNISTNRGIQFPSNNAQMDKSIAVDTVLLLADVFFNQTYYVTGNSVITLPNLAGACPSGVRLNFVTDGGTCTFATGAGFASFICIVSSTNATALTTFTNIQDTDAYASGSFIQVMSTSGNKWIVSVTSGN